MSRMEPTQPILCPLHGVYDFAPCDPAEVDPLVDFLLSDSPVSDKRAFPRGTLTADGRLDLGLTIRTDATDGRRMHSWAGGGIVWDSDPAAEVAEAAAKAAPVRDALSAS